MCRCVGVCLMCVMCVCACHIAKCEVDCQSYICGGCRPLLYFSFSRTLSIYITSGWCTNSISLPFPCCWCTLGPNDCHNVCVSPERGRACAEGRVTLTPTHTEKCCGPWRTASEQNDQTKCVYEREKERATTLHTV